MLETELLFSENQRERHQSGKSISSGWAECLHHLPSTSSSVGRMAMEALPTLRVEHLPEAQKRTRAIRDNRLGELAGSLG